MMKFRFSTAQNAWKLGISIPWSSYGGLFAGQFDKYLPWEPKILLSY